MIVRIATFLGIVLFVLVCRRTNAQNNPFPPNPCPDIFQYSEIGGENIGIITVNNVTFGQTKVEILLTQDGDLQSNFSGNLSPNFNKEKFFEYASKGKLITLRVDFPQQNVIPQVTLIRVNGVEICSGPKAHFPSSKIKLHCTIDASIGTLPKLRSKRSYGNPNWPNFNSPNQPNRNQHSLNQQPGNDPSANFVRSLNRKNSYHPEHTQPIFNQPQFTQATFSQPYGNDPSANFVMSLMRKNLNQPRHTQSTFHQPTFNQPMFNPPSLSVPTYNQHSLAQPTGNDPSANFVMSLMRKNLNQPGHTQSTFHQPTFYQPMFNQPTFNQPTFNQPTFNPQFVPSISPAHFYYPDPIDDISTRNNPLSITPVDVQPSGPIDQATFEYINSVCGQENRNMDYKNLNVNGKAVARSRFPWIVAIFRKNNDELKFHCGGSLISTKTVVSAAHCFYLGLAFLEPEEVVVSVGRHSLLDQTGAFNMEVERIVTHPDYKAELVNFDADIAIVRFKQSVRFTLAVRPVCMWQGPSDPRNIEGTSGIIVGWGSDGRTNTTTVPTLVDITVVSEVECLRSNELYAPLTSHRTLCAGSPYRDSGPCIGDSGNGLMIKKRNKWMLRGSVSASIGTPDGECNVKAFAIYSDIAMFLEWIQTNMWL